MTDEAPTTLGSTGQIHVTLAAARIYADARRLGLESARRELHVLLAGARRASTQPADGAEGWRIRSRALRVDAHVSREGELAVVVHVRVRDYRPRER